MSSLVLEKRYCLPGGLSNVSGARRWLSEALAPLGLPQTTVDELKVALSEATTNALVHGRPAGDPSPVELRCRVEPARLVIEIEADGVPFVPATITLPEIREGHPRGRGLFLMQQFVDRLEFLPRERGVRVRMIKELPA